MKKNGGQKSRGTIPLSSLKAQLRFAYCVLGFQTVFCFCGATFSKVRRPVLPNGKAVLPVKSWATLYSAGARLCQA
jgi:hypothetical protein